MKLEQRIVEQLAMLAGMILYTLFNYVGQRFFAFKYEQNEKEK